MGDKVSFSKSFFVFKKIEVHLFYTDKNSYLFNGVPAKSQFLQFYSQQS